MKMSMIAGKKWGGPVVAGITLPACSDIIVLVFCLHYDSVKHLLAFIKEIIIVLRQSHDVKIVTEIGLIVRNISGDMGCVTLWLCIK